MHSQYKTSGTYINSLNSRYLATSFVAGTFHPTVGSFARISLSKTPPWSWDSCIHQLDYSLALGFLEFSLDNQGNWIITNSMSNNVIHFLSFLLKTQ